VQRAGGQVEKIGHPSGILIAPDGKRAFIARSNAGKVQVLDLGSLTIAGSVATGNQPDLNGLG